jgi:hypothetical protein
LSKPEKKGDGVSMKVAMQAYLKAMGMDQKMLEMEVLSKWPKLMGDDVDKRTESKEIKDGVLYLNINSSVMRDELFQMRSVIIKRINEEAGFEIIRDVFFR